MENKLMENLFDLHGNSFLIDNIFVALANYSTHFFAVVFLITAAYLFYAKFRLKKKLWLSSLLVLPAVLLVNHIIRQLIQRDRPFVLEEEFSSLVYHYYQNSFPSNHAAGSFAVAGILYLIYPPWGRFFFGVAALISVSRVYVGVHFPSDVFAGAAVALIILALFLRYRDKIETYFNALWKGMRSILEAGK